MKVEDSLLKEFGHLGKSISGLDLYLQHGSSLGMCAYIIIDFDESLMLAYLDLAIGFVCSDCSYVQ